MKFIWPAIGFIAAIISYPLYEDGNLNILVNEKVGFIFLLLFMLFPLPTLIIHTMYYLNDKNKTVEINKETGSICISDGIKNDCYSKEDIEGIDIFFNNGYRNALKGYYYAKITLRNGNYKMVTCLTVSNETDFPFITKRTSVMLPVISTNKNWIF